MDVRSGLFLGFLMLFCAAVVVPVSADTGFFIHSNIDGARVIVGDTVIGEIEEHECWVPWPYESNKEHLVIAADGYREVWDTLLQPWPGVPEHRYYRMQPLDPEMSLTDGDVRVLVHPAALNYVYVRDRSPGASDTWEFVGDWYGTEFTLHYLPMGIKEIMIKRTNFVDVSQEVYVIPNWETDIAFEMVRTEEPEPLDAAASVEYTQPERSVQKQASILVIETPAPEPVEQVQTASAGDVNDVVRSSSDTADVIPEDGEDGAVNVGGIMLIICVIGLFCGAGYLIFTKAQLV